MLGAEGGGEEFAEGERAADAVGSGGVHGRARVGELGEALATATTARRDLVAVGDRQHLDDGVARRP